jgi:uncharacterized membrane protein (UPF0127 family)
MSSARHYLAPLLGREPRPYVLRIERDGALLASHIELAGDSKSRRRGLLGRTGLPAGHVLVIAPCNGIHTFFMRFAIDVVFTDRQGRILTIARGLRPWRMAVSLRAFAALELAAGAADRAGARRGDRVLLSES